MSEEKSRLQTVFYWWERAENSLDAASRELEAGDLSLAINRLYYSCFYAVSAVLLYQGLTFTKHSAVKAMFHKQLINSGLIDRKWPDTIPACLKIDTRRIICPLWRSKRHL